MHFLSQLTVSFVFLLPIVELCISSSTGKPLKLGPIIIVEHDPPFELRPREVNPYSKLDPKTQGHLMYGNKSDNGSLVFANMTLYASNGMLMVLLEHFDHLTSTVDCQGDDGEMSLTFKSQEAYQYALQAWGYINARANDSFLLVANHEGCGPDQERQAYIINSVREDTVTLTTYLEAKPAPWSDVAGSYDLEFRHFVTHPHSLQRRNRWNGNFDETREKDFDTSIGQPDKSQTIWHDDVRLLLDCIDCFVAGSFHVIGHIKTRHWDPKVATMSIRPNNFNATLELEATVTDTEKPEELSAKKELFSMPVPELGFEIEHLCKVGLTVGYSVGFSTKFLGSATIDFGATSTLPNDAIIDVDLLHPEKSSYSGFDNAAMIPIFDVTKLSASVKFAVFTQADIKFGIEVEKLAGWDVELNLKIPQLSTTVNAGYDAAGFCSKDAGAMTTGAKITTAIAIELWLEIYYKIKEKKTNIFSHRFFQAIDTLNEECQPLDMGDFIQYSSQDVSELLPVPTGLIQPS